MADTVFIVLDVDDNGIQGNGFHVFSTKERANAFIDKCKGTVVTWTYIVDGPELSRKAPH